MGKAKSRVDLFDDEVDRIFNLCAQKLYLQALAAAERTASQYQEFNKDRDLIYIKAVALKELGRYEEAIIAAKDALELAPGDYDIIAVMANSHYMSYQHAEALQLYMELEAIDDSKPLSARKIADCYKHMGEPNKALTYIQQAIARAEKLADRGADYGHNFDTRGEILVALRRYDEAIKDYETAHKHGFGHYFLMHKADALFGKGAYQDALNAYKIASGTNFYTEGLIGAARCYYKLGQIDKCKIIVKQIDSQKQYLSTHRRCKEVSELKLWLGDYEGALEAINEAIRFNPHHFGYIKFSDKIIAELEAHATPEAAHATLAKVGVDEVVGKYFNVCKDNISQIFTGAAAVNSGMVKVDTAFIMKCQDAGVAKAALIAGKVAGLGEELPLIGLIFKIVKNVAAAGVEMKIKAICKSIANVSSDPSEYGKLAEILAMKLLAVRYGELKNSATSFEVRKELAIKLATEDAQSFVASVATKTFVPEENCSLVFELHAKKVVVAYFANVLKIDASHLPDPMLEESKQQRAIEASYDASTITAMMDAISGLDGAGGSSDYGTSSSSGLVGDLAEVDV